MSDETFGNFLKRKFHEWSGKEIGRGHSIPSQADFSKYLGIATTNLSVWMNDVRKPTGNSIDQLAEKLGLEVYDKLGVARRMPANRRMYSLLDIAYSLDEEGQKELLEHARNIRERRKGGDGQTETLSFA